MMKVKSVNIGKIKTVKWKNKTIKTGIFKTPVNQIVLGGNDVELDQVVDRKYHGGLEKACYIYSEDHYAYWQKLYPNLEFNFGMFGENITITGLNESKIFIGDIYKLGDATVQVTQPREPCFKLGIKFGTQAILKQFINAPYPGIYLKVIETGLVKAEDTFQLIERQHDSMSVTAIYHLRYKTHFDKEDIEQALALTYLGADFKSSLVKKLKHFN
ncbi:MAG: MOSC domain-containing protein [Putridiphycobacter sp.]